jgi:1-acyl-sn-glycerol-3-phosphate acyltransferase
MQAKDLLRVNVLIEKALIENRGVVVFAEGTSTSGESILVFRPSLLDAAARHCFPVHYASLTYTVPAGEKPAGLSVCWWGDMDFFPHICDLMKMPGFDARVVFGREVVVSAERKELAQKLQHKVEEQFVPVAAPLTV